MQLLHCEYELINSYNCPVIVFFVCRLFWMAYIYIGINGHIFAFAFVFALSKIAWLLFVRIFPSEIMLFIQLELHTLVPKMDIHIWLCLPIFENFIACYFLSLSFCLSLLCFISCERMCVCVCVCVLRHFAIRISLRLIRHLFLYLLQLVNVHFFYKIPYNYFVESTAVENVYDDVFNTRIFRYILQVFF